MNVGFVNMSSDWIQNVQKRKRGRLRRSLKDKLLGLTEL